MAHEPWSVASTDPGATTTSAPVDACGAARTLQKKSLAEAFARARRPPSEADKSDPLSEADIAERLSQLHERCLPGKQGAWALVVERLSDGPWTGWGGVQILFSVVYVDQTGVRGRAWPFAGSSSDAEPKASQR